MHEDVVYTLYLFAVGLINCREEEHSLEIFYSVAIQKDSTHRKLLTKVKILKKCDLEQ